MQKRMKRLIAALAASTIAAVSHASSNAAAEAALNPCPPAGEYVCASTCDPNACPFSCKTFDYCDYTGPCLGKVTVYCSP